MEEKKSYYAIIPANVRYDNRLRDKAKLLYGEITALCNERGYCWASNEYFANLYNVSKVTISTLIKELVDYGYIYTEIIYRDGTKEILNRYLKIFKDPIKEILNTPIKEILKDNNTIINNTFNKEKNIIKKEEKSKRFIKPTIEEIKAYCEERNNGIDAESFYYHYESIDWYVGNHRMTNWKSCIITWEKRNKARKQAPIKEDTSDIIRRMREESSHGAR